MYSPKIKPELIPQLYWLAKAVKKPMTVVVSAIIEDYLAKGDEAQGRDDLPMNGLDSLK